MCIANQYLVSKTKSFHYYHRSKRNEDEEREEEEEEKRRKIMGDNQFQASNIFSIYTVQQIKLLFFYQLARE